MAGYADDKTEPPTQRRRNETRQKGQVARSQDLTAAVLLLSAFVGLGLFGGALWSSFLAMVRAGLTAPEAWSIRELIPFAAAVATESLKRLAPLLLIMFGAMLITLLMQVGLLFSWVPLTPSLSKISPLQGIKRLLSVRSLMLAATNFGKLLIVGVVVYLTLAGQASAILYAFMVDFYSLTGLGAALMYQLGINVGVALLILALLDFAWQRHKHERDMRMTKEEVKDELRSMEGDPIVKRRRREVQYQMAMQRIRKDVPTADVVVTNPTHVAVAIRYDAESMPAPKVVAKGADLMALRIRQLANEFSIPIVSRPPLARALFQSVEVGGYVPEGLYKAIAEILAYVYELSGHRLRRSVGATVPVS